MAPAQVQQLNFEQFWIRLGRRVLKMMAGHAHADVIITIHDGKLQRIQFNERVLPTNLPEA